MRTDVHSPTNLVTEDYEYEFAAYTGPGGLVGLMSTEAGRELWHGLIRDIDPAMEHRSTSQCHHCGAHLMYVAFLRHKPTGHTIVVGETCLENRFERASSDFHQLRKQAKLDRERQRITALCEETLEALEHDGYEHAPQVLQRDFDLGLVGYLTDWPREVTEDIRARFWKYGNVSRKQADLVEKLVAEIPAKLEEKSRRAAEKAAEVEVPAPTGREVIEGEVIKADWRLTDFGETLKLTIKSSTDEGVWLGWVTCPSSLSCERGDRVRLTATWKPAEEGGNFAFGKRPTKAVNLTKEKDQ